MKGLGAQNPEHLGGKGRRAQGEVYGVQAGIKGVRGEGGCNGSRDGCNGEREKGAEVTELGR